MLMINRPVQQEIQWNSQFPGKKNPVLLQQKEENVSEETNDDADINAEANKVNDNKKDMVVTMKE